MNTKKKTLCYIIIATLIASLTIKSCLGDIGSFYPTDTNDDGFITQIGNHFRDTPYLPLRSATTDVISGLRFRSLNIPQDAKINNATLFVRTLHTYDPGVVLVTIYGVDENDAYAFNSSGDFTRPYTTNNVVWNVSEVNGYAWHNVSVTEIVQEIISRYGWRSGNSLAFIILADSGDPRREFATIDNNIAWRPRLDITWAVTPPSPSDDAPPPYNNTDEWTWDHVNSSQGMDIWTATNYGEHELFYTSSSDLDFHNSLTGLDGVVDWTAGGFGFQTAGAAEFIARLDPWVFLIGDNLSTSIYYSDDEFSAGSIRVEECNAQFPALDNYAGNPGSIWLDQNDTQTIHVVWSTVTDWQPATYNIVYSNFTILEDGSLQWSLDYVNITNVATEQMDPDIYCEQDGTLHIVWYGRQGTAEDQIWYMRRYANGTWGPQVRCSEGDSFGSREPDVVANEVTGEALVAWTYYTATNSIRWNIVYPNNTDGPDGNIANSQYVSMVNDRENDDAHMAFNSPAIGNPSVDYRWISIDNLSAWSAASNISPNGEQHRNPTISLDEQNDTLAVIWWNEWNTWTAHNHWEIGGAIAPGKIRIANPQLRYPSSPDYYGRNINQVVYFTVYPNGTIHDGPFDTEDEAEDAIEEELGVDPEDPQTDVYGEALTKNRWKTFVFVIGMVMFLGTPTFAMMARVSTGRWIMVLFISLCGLSILWSLIYM